MTPFTDHNMWYGRYVKKSSPVVSAVLVRQFERDHYNQIADGRIARGEIGRAHSMLDALNVPRLQPNGLSLSLEGRLRHLKRKGGETVKQPSKQASDASLRRTICLKKPYKSTRGGVLCGPCRRACIWAGKGRRNG